MSVTIRADTAGLSALIDELEDATMNAARPAAQAAAQVLYDEVHRNVSRIGRKTGNLSKAIYQAYAHAESNESRATYHVSWNPKRAPHGHLIENGHIQRYAAYVGKDGNWYTAVRAEMRGKRKPKRRATQAEKDAYYVTLPVPAQIAAQSFVRAASVRFPQALDAAAAELMRRIG